MLMFLNGSKEMEETYYRQLTVSLHQIKIFIFSLQWLVFLLTSGTFPLREKTIGLCAIQHFFPQYSQIYFLTLLLRFIKRNQKYFNQPWKVLLIIQKLFRLIIYFFFLIPCFPQWGVQVIFLSLSPSKLFSEHESLFKIMSSKSRQTINIFIKNKIRSGYLTKLSLAPFWTECMKRRFFILQVLFYLFLGTVCLFSASS